MKCFYWGDHYYWGVLAEEEPLIHAFIEEQHSAANTKLTMDDYRFIYEEHIIAFHGLAVLDDWRKVPPRKQARVLKYISRL